MIDTILDYYLKKIFYFFYKILFIFNKIFNKITKRSFLIWFSEFFQNDCYKYINILDNKIKFFIPNEIVNWRVSSFFSKEPETLEWIDNFENKENLIFWDIGANIGLYSIYNAIKNKKSTTIAFEPSSSNLRVLTRNISINNLENDIKVFPIPLSNKENYFQIMNEGSFVEGGALNSFGERYDFDGKEFNPKMKYNIFGTSINSLIKNKILTIPDYIKIDVDGIEHLILEGGDMILNDKKIKSLSIEINENFEIQYNNILKIMNKFNFRILHKKHNNEMSDPKSKFNKTYNYVFVR